MEFWNQIPEVDQIGRRGNTYSMGPWNNKIWMTFSTNFISIAVAWQKSKPMCAAMQSPSDVWRHLVWRKLGTVANTSLVLASCSHKTRTLASTVRHDCNILRVKMIVWRTMRRFGGHWTSWNLFLCCENWTPYPIKNKWTYFRKYILACYLTCLQHVLFFFFPFMALW